MAEWQHKERNWSKEYQDDKQGNRISVALYYDDGGIRGPKPEFQKFTDWLDWQCEDGWEVIKISRNFAYEAQSSTWCIFRKK